MNIFFLHQDPVIAAQMNCDQHCVKIPIEICQMIACGFTKEQLAHYECPRTVTGKVRGHFNPNHPVTKWVLKDWLNYNWTYNHMMQLVREKRKRYILASDGLQSCLDFLFWSVSNQNLMVSNGHIQTVRGTEFPKCISKDSLTRQRLGDKLNSMSPIEAYRAFYRYDKVKFATWRLGNKPEWMQ